MMRSFLTISVPADELSLLTVEEMRAAVGIGDPSYDDDLIAMEAQNAAAIMTECNIAVGGGDPPTLRREMVTETFFDVCEERLSLSRRHDVEIYSVEMDGTTLPDDDYMVDPESGRLTRLDGGYPSSWSARKIIVVYDAGFATVPGDLAKVAGEYLRSSWQERSRDPLVKSERTKIDDVEEVERQFWVGAVPGQSGTGTVPDFVSRQLKRFRNFTV